MALPVVRKSDEIVDAILLRISDGESLRTICKTRGMPHRVTFLRWVNDDEKLQKLYTDALKWREQIYFDDLIGIADECKDPAKARVMSDNRKWVLARMNPKKYGDKMTQELSGVDGGPMVVELVQFAGAPENAPD
ncbi:hypothetical protein WM40_22630 [Robbsia andropogonis]|uniref:Terminase small subunit protein n=1 Tax=Robbsia andropogonis TaxID=28092 RepID=A0A0F5JV95_9BURK|nr:hypothetical protein [Robbsia andropogonis]KKB61539.1 hypothetical protein WM40_22630 [Robbsia andropogonis]